MEKLVPKVWVLTSSDDQDGNYFKGDCPDLDTKGRLKPDVMVEILPLETRPYHNSFIDKPLWYEGPEVQYSPRRLFFEHLGFSMRRRNDLYSHVMLSILFRTTEKHPDTRTLAIVFPDKAVFEDTEARDIIHIIQKSFVDDYQTPKGRQNEILSRVESIYLILSPSAETQIGQLKDALKSSVEMS